MMPETKLYCDSCKARTEHIPRGWNPIGGAVWACKECGETTKGPFLNQVLET
mgnify:CR=1 FL=1